MDCPLPFSISRFTRVSLHPCSICYINEMSPSCLSCGQMEKFFYAANDDHNIINERLLGLWSDQLRCFGSWYQRRRFSFETFRFRNMMMFNGRNYTHNLCLNIIRKSIHSKCDKIFRPVTYLPQCHLSWTTLVIKRAAMKMILLIFVYF